MAAATPPSTSKAYLCLLIIASTYLDWRISRLVLNKRLLPKLINLNNHNVILKSIYEWPLLPQLYEAFLGENESIDNTIQKVSFSFYDSF